MPLKLFGLVFMIAGWFLRRQFNRARQDGFARSGGRRITRSGQRLRFNVLLVSHALGALILFVAGMLCLTHAGRLG